MKKALTTAIVAMLVLGAVPTLAGGAKEVELVGWITDEWCGAKNANAEGAGCARACAKKGAELVVFSDGNLYKLSDKEMALAHVGHEVVVRGTLGEDGKSLEVSSIEKAESGEKKT